MKYVGIDVHKKMCQVAVLDDDGELLDETRFRNTLEGIEEFAQRLSAYGDEVKAVVESTGKPVDPGPRQARGPRLRRSPLEPRQQPPRL